MESCLRSLILLGTLALPETWAGSHSLRYFYTAVASPELPEPRFLVVGCVDDQQFVRFDSARASPRMEPRAAWMERMDWEEPGYWEREVRNMEGETQSFLEYLNTLRGYFNHSQGGVHTLQRTYGCEVSSKLTFQRGFQQDAYDGRDYIALDTETSTWTAAVPEAVNTKREWEANTTMAERRKAYLEEECVLWLKKYLEMGKETLQRPGTPAPPQCARHSRPPLPFSPSPAAPGTPCTPDPTLTRHTAPHGEVTLRCRAQDFYPADISLTWLRDGEERVQDVEFIETRPAGDGTFQKWAGVDVTSGQEEKYTCRVQHEGLPKPLTLKWEPESSSTWFIVGVIGAVLIIIIIAGLAIWRIKTLRRGS
ncbi:class I histocompatibility antigen, Gogo-A*0201 alpha chain-like [Vombatus ursinus]|uniref:class I histocompatibility antigen, Gogo-A*0201 alpha chain-like n=1 Tax=Vombatus ursinus TaxID=29139 RepID=UPI000FFDA3EA|nr:class I histocompatibility antigen, Gogo-A*0201 alpha chain-like [Vombatus ursinus]